MWRFRLSHRKSLQVCHTRRGILPTMTTTSDGFYRPPLHSSNVARKCIICGTTKHEIHMKPILIKGDALNAWANNHFRTKPHRLQTFYSKLRYTLNPYGCINHFKVVLDPRPTPPKVACMGLGRIRRRACDDFLMDGEEPPSIERITERKPSPPPEAKEPRSKEQVNDVVMGILKTAAAEMERVEERKQMLIKVARQMLNSDEAEGEGTVHVDRKKKRRMRSRGRREKTVADGNEADSDGSTIDVETMESEDEQQESSLEEESDDDMVIPSMRQREAFPRLSPPQTPVGLVPMRRPLKPYHISSPSKSMSRGGMPFRRTIPQRLTLTAATGKNYQRPSWVAPNPGQAALASVLQKFWNEEGLPSGGRYTKKRREQQHKDPVGRTVIARTRSKFGPASKMGASLRLLTPPTMKLPRILNSTIRTCALLGNPPLSPSRLSIAAEETVNTSPVETERVRMPSFLSTSSEGEEPSEVDVCGNAGLQPLADGLKIEGQKGFEEQGEVARDRTNSTALSGISEELEMESSDGENTEVDVETVDETLVQKLKSDAQKNAAATVATPIREPPKTGVRHDRRKQRLMPYAGDGPFVRISKKKMTILPPRALVQPPTRLLSFGLEEMKEALHAQARAAAEKPVRIALTAKGPPFKLRCLIPKDLRTPFDAKPESEWSRLEKVMERKLAERKERELRAEKLKEAQMNSDDPPPVLEVASGTDEVVIRKDEAMTSGREQDGVIESLAEGFAKKFRQSLNVAMCKGAVLRMRYNKKEGDDDAHKMKVVDLPQGVGREEEVVGDCLPMEKSLSMIEGDLKRKHFQDVRKAIRQVTRPSLVIEKDDVMEMIEKLNAPPPVPVVGIPDKEEFQARREMFEQKRHEEMLRTGLIYGRMREEIEGSTSDSLNGGKDKELGVGDACSDKMVKARKEEAKRAGRKMKKEKAESVDVLSDIESDEEEETIEIRIDENDGDWKMNGERRKKKKMEETENEEESDNRRKSHRLKEKRASGRKWNPIWMKSDDDDDDDPILVEIPAAEQHVAPTTEKRKRGRPRKNPEGPQPPKKKRDETKKITETEKDVLSRVFPSFDLAKEETREERPKKEEKKNNLEIEQPKIAEEMEMEIVDLDPSRDETETANEDDDDMPVLLEKQEPKPAGDGPVPPVKRRPMWTWKQRPGSQTDTGGRLCKLCTITLRRDIWIPNESVALMDHARTHCVETLMCPSSSCTYMNSMRSKISQHVTYVHKKWGRPIDLAEMYPTLRRTLLLRLRQCFPDQANLSVCHLCRVAVLPHRDHRRWHAQTHLDTRVFECSRDKCTAKFYSEQECNEHILTTNCNGTIVNGMTDEMEATVSLLVRKCFGTILLSVLSARKDNVSVKASDGEAASTSAPAPASSTSTPMPPTLKMEIGEKKDVEDVAGPSR